ncbi:MAG: hypothetical protein RI842_10680 [Schleiferiaceae bacterium]|nr:hypothetical protein [Schleiferiaceae bacterium]
MNKYSLFALVCVFFMLSCEKQNKNSANPSKSRGGLIEMVESLKQDVDYDFHVLVSTSTHGGPSPEDGYKSRVSIQAASAEETYQGDLSVHGYDIPFKRDRFYSLTANTYDRQDVFLGENIEYELNNPVGTIPSFTATQYVPELSDGFQYEGLVNGEEIDPNSGFTVHWTPDPYLPENAVSVLAIEEIDTSFTGEGIEDHILIEVEDQQGSYNVTPEMLTDLSDHRFVKVMYGRGYTESLDLEGKTVGFDFIGFTWNSLPVILN